VAASVAASISKAQVLHTELLSHVAQINSFSATFPNWLYDTSGCLPWSVGRLLQSRGLAAYTYIQTYSLY